MGAPCVDEGVPLGAHGRISNIPAFDIGITQEWQENDFVISVRGKVREATVFGENLVLTRTITTKLGDNTIHINDCIENEGFSPTPLMMLYHMNFGYPLVSESSVLETNCENIRPRDEIAAPGIDDACKFSNPIHDFSEQVFYRDAVANSYATLKNPELNLGATISFSGVELPYFIEWKQMGEQEYVVGLEPATYPPDGRAKARERNELLLLNSQELRSHKLVISFETI